MKKLNNTPNENEKPQNEPSDVENQDENGEDIVFSPEIEEILANYRAELDELYENRRKRAIIRSQMTEEEIIASMEIDLLDVYEHALENGMDIVEIGSEELDQPLDEDGEDDNGEDENENGENSEDGES